MMGNTVMVLKTVLRNSTTLNLLLTIMMIREPSIRMFQLPKRPKLRRKKLPVHHQNWLVSSQLLPLHKLVTSTITMMEKKAMALRMEPKRPITMDILQIIMIASRKRKRLEPRRPEPNKERHQREECHQSSRN